MAPATAQQRAEHRREVWPPTALYYQLRPHSVIHEQLGEPPPADATQLLPTHPQMNRSVALCCQRCIAPLVALARNGTAAQTTSVAVSELRWQPDEGEKVKLLLMEALPKTGTTVYPKASGPL